MRRRDVVMAMAGAVLLTNTLAGCAPSMSDGSSASAAGAPVFEVDPFWPKPLPNNWLMGQAAGNGPKDGMILKFTRDGRLLLKIGEPGVVGNDADTAHLNRPANMVVDPATRELFVADGYGNHRVIVFDADTGSYKRHWGASGRPPGDAGVKGFANPVHCVRLSRDGTFVREFVVAPQTRGNGSTWDADLSKDGPQTYLYNADGKNNQVWMLLRESGRVLGSFGRNGRSAGQFHWVHNMVVDSAGNIYTTEVDSGKRAQKFVLKSR
jgi:hypothetical protein